MFKNSKRNRVAKKRRRQQIRTLRNNLRGRFESLETRTLLAADVAFAAELAPAALSPLDDINATFTVAAAFPSQEEINSLNPPTSVVIVTGTDEADRISAFVDEDNMLHVSINGEVRVFDNASIDSIFVDAQDGDDLIHIDRSVLQSTHILGGDGNDNITAGSGNDYVDGGAGNDVIRGEFGNDLLEGGNGNDIIAGGFGNDAILGGRGNDILVGGRGADGIAGGSGADTIVGGAGNDFLFGDATNTVPDDFVDIIDYALRFGNVNTGNDKIYAGAGNDIVLAGNGNDLVHGEDGADLLLGGNGSDTIRAGLGNDIVLGGRGSDELSGGEGNDIVVGDPLNLSSNAPDDGPVVDAVFEVAGIADADAIFREIDAQPVGALPIEPLTPLARRSNDTIFGGLGDDILLGGLGNDEIFGGRGNDAIHGGAGDDLLNGGAGNDLLVGALGNDTLNGDLGHDRLFGGQGNDLLNGGEGDDTIDGGAGDDIVIGGAGDDKLRGGTGSDILFGGPGADKIDTQDGEVDFLILDDEDEVELDEGLDIVF